MKCMRKAGVQIEALIEYVALYQQGEETACARKAILEEQRAVAYASGRDAGIFASVG